jgi:hypothetical protein
MMDPNIKTLWVNALRSGQYKQISGNLCKEVNGTSCFCALGVLCEVHRIHHLNRNGLDIFGWGYYWKGTRNDWDWRRTYLGADTSLPETVREWAGLSSYDPSVHWEEGVSSIVDLNDDRKFCFNDIADLIEADKTI